jgi:hypothetical protein
MATMTLNTTRTTHLLELMKKGDDAFNSRDVAAMNATHHPDIIAHIMGIPDPVLGRVAHAATLPSLPPRVLLARRHPGQLLAPLRVPPRPA